MILGILAFSFIFQNSCTNNVSAASITLTIPSEPLSLNISDPSDGESFHKSSASSFSVKTDSSTGYTISIKSKNSDSDAAKSNDLVNSSSESSKLTSILAAVSETDFSSSGGANTWGYLPSKLNGSENTNFIPGPTSEATILDNTSSATGDDGNTPNEYNITLGTKVDSNTSSGSYSNTFILTAVANKPKDMQNFSCDLGDGEITELTDSRDGNVYKIAKLKDGKCWMIENLRLGDEKLQNRTITPENSDVSSDFTIPPSSTSGFNSNTAISVYVDSGQYGGYYTYNAATAGTGGAMSSGEAPDSLCPKGWRLPTGGPGGEFEELANQYGSSSNQTAWANAMQAKPLPGFVLSGEVDSRSPNRQGVCAWYQSSTIESLSAPYALDICTTSVYPSGPIGGKADGWAIRCVAGVKNKYNITYNLNSGSWSGTSPQVGSTSDNKIKLDEATPTKSDYEFKGWCDEETSDSTCSGTTYQPGADFPLTSIGNATTLYAMWGGPGSCPQPVAECSYNGVSGKRYANSPCYQSLDAATYTPWSSASSYCPSGWTLPSKTDFDNLVSSSQAGSGACLYEQGWQLNGSDSYGGGIFGKNSYGYYWSSTNEGGYYDLLIYSSNSQVTAGCLSGGGCGFSVRCMHS